MVVLASAVLGCGSSGSGSSPPVGTYAGTVTGSDAFVAVVAGKAHLVAYVCDGAHGIADLFTGRRSTGALVLRDSRGARVSLAIEPHSATGEFTPPRGSRALAFEVPVARGKAGLYRVVRRLRGARTTIGWVVLNDGHQRGAMTIAGRTLTAPTLSTSTGTATVGSVTISATRISPGSVSSSGLSGFNGFSGFGG